MICQKGEMIIPFAAGNVAVQRFRAFQFYQGMLHCAIGV